MPSSLVYEPLVLTRAHNYTKEEGMQLIELETAKFELLLKIALSHAHALQIIIVVMDIDIYRM